MRLAGTHGSAGRWWSQTPGRPIAVEIGQHGSRHLVKVAQLGPAERRRVLVDTPRGLEPAAFWLSEYGLPVAVPSWKNIFADANARCRVEGVDIYCHPHMLRHTFAV